MDGNQRDLLFISGAMGPRSVGVEDLPVDLAKCAIASRIEHIISDLIDRQMIASGGFLFGLHLFDLFDAADKLQKFSGFLRLFQVDIEHTALLINVILDVAIFEGGQAVNRKTCAVGHRL